MNAILRASASMAALAVMLAGCMETVGYQEVTPARYIAPTAIAKRIQGNTLYREAWQGAAKLRYVSHHRTDGTMTARFWWFGGDEQATGTWVVTEDGLYCRQWSNWWADGKRGCFSVAEATKDGTLIFDHVNGAAGDSVRYRYKVLAGNPHRL